MSEAAAMTELENGRLLLLRRLDEMPRLHAFVAARVADSGWPQALIFPLQLCLEEAVANAIRHGAAPAGALVAVTLGEREGRVVATVEDEGVPFDPTAAALAPLGRSLEQQCAGGHGLRLMRGFAARLEYSRVGGRNRLLLEFDSAR